MLLQYIALRCCADIQRQKNVPVSGRKTHGIILGVLGFLFFTMHDLMLDRVNRQVGMHLWVFVWMGMGFLGC
jgi:hypothetical protein